MTGVRMKREIWTWSHRPQGQGHVHPETETGGRWLYIENMEDRRWPPEGGEGGEGPFWDVSPPELLQNKFLPFEAPRPAVRGASLWQPREANILHNQSLG